MIDSPIGAGGMGVIYKAKQIPTRRTVALKVLREDLARDRSSLERFLFEVRLLARMEHPNMVRVYEGGFDGRFAYFSMEFISGEDLKLAIARGRRFPEAEALSIAGEVASALDYAWRKEHMIHRDVKPANIMLTSGGTAKLLDLGISKQISGGDTLLTNPGTMIGSPAYMSPEQARGEQDIDFRADIYSLGITLYHLLAGSHPYGGDTAADVISRHLSAPVPDLRIARPDVSRRFARALRRMMAKERTGRFSSWEDFRSELEAIRKTENKRRRRISSRRFQTALKYFRPRMLLPALLCLLTAGGLLLFYASRTAKRSNPPPAQTAVPPDTADASARMQPFQPPRTEKARYAHFREGLKQWLQERCDKFILSGQFAEGIRFLRERNEFPAEVRKNGVFEKDFLRDRGLQNFLEGRAALFRHRLEQREKGLE